MAGSHTMMPGIIYKKTTVLNLVSASSGIVSNNQTGIQYTLVRPVAAGGSNFNGHSNNTISTTSVLRPIGKIEMQPSNNTTYVITSANNIKSNTSISHCQLNSNGVSTKDSLQTSNPPNSGSVSVVNKENKIEVVGVTSIKKESQEEPKEDLVIAQEQEEEEPVIDIVINNVVGSFAVGCHLNLRNIALSGKNVEFRKENGMVTMKLRRPFTTASIWSSGKITCTGSTSEEQAKIAARRVARVLQKLGYNTRFRNFRVVNVLGTCTMPFAIKIAQFSQQHRRAASYEPELHPGVTYRIPHPKATLKIFSTGSITVTAPSVNNVQSAIETIYPLVKEYSKARTQDDVNKIKNFIPLDNVEEIGLVADGSHVERQCEDDDDCVEV